MDARNRPPTLGRTWRLARALYALREELFDAGQDDLGAKLDAIGDEVGELEAALNAIEGDASFEERWRIDLAAKLTALDPKDGESQRSLDTAARFGALRERARLALGGKAAAPERSAAA